MSLNYVIQDPAVIIGSKNVTTNIFTAVALKNYYDFDGTASKIIETGEGSKLLHRGKDILEFDSVLPIPTSDKKDLFAAVIEVLANKKIYLPIILKNLYKIIIYL